MWTNVFLWCRRFRFLDLVLYFVAVYCRRDSSVIKEEIKSFLANRRISQAVVAQVTGGCWSDETLEGKKTQNRTTTCQALKLLSDPEDLFLQGSARVGSPTGFCSRDRTSVSRRNGPSFAGTSWRRPTPVITCEWKHSHGLSVHRNKKKKKSNHDLKLV